MAPTETLSEKPKLKVRWTDEEVAEFNRHIGVIFCKVTDKTKMRYSPTSSFPQICTDEGKPSADSSTFVPRYNIEMFTWKNGKNPGGDEKTIQNAKQPHGQFFCDCELFLNNYKPE